MMIQYDLCLHSTVHKYFQFIFGRNRKNYLPGKCMSGGGCHPVEGVEFSGLTSKTFKKTARA